MEGYRYIYGISGYLRSLISAMVISASPTTLLTSSSDVSRAFLRVSGSASSVEQKNGNGNVKGNKTNNNGVEVNRNEDQNGGVDAKGQAKKKPNAPGGGPLLQQA